MPRGPGEEVGLPHLVRLDRVRQRAHDRLLADDLAEDLRAVLAVEGGHKAIQPDRPVVEGAGRCRRKHRSFTIENRKTSICVYGLSVLGWHCPSNERERQFHESVTCTGRQQPREEGSLVGWRHPVCRDGVLRRRLRPEGHRHPVCLPHHSAARHRRHRSRRCRSGRVLHGDLDGRLDRPPDRPQALPGEGVLGRGRSRHRPVHRQDRLRHRPLRGRLDRQPHVVDHRQRLRLQGAQGPAPRGHADPDALRQDLPGPGARHRDGARVPGQVRPSDPRRDREAEARPLGQELRPRRLRGARRRTRLHQGRREHQLPAVHALARPLPLRHRRRAEGAGRQRRGQGPLHERHGRDDGGDVRAGRVRQGARQRDLHDRPDDRLHRHPVDGQVVPRERADPPSAPRRPRHVHPPEDARRQLPRHLEVGAG